MIQKAKFKYYVLWTVKVALSFLLLSLFACSAANPNIKSITSGDVAAYLKKAPKAEEHPNAGVVMLFSYDYTEFLDNGTSITRHYERVKIFNERGRRFATQSISYREGHEEINILFANTIKPNGQVVALNKNDIHDRSRYSDYQFYTDIKEKSFTMPAVENDCIIEIAYEVKNLKPVLPFDLFAIINLQNAYPLEEDVMEIVIPANIELKYKQFNTALAPKIIKEGDKKRYIFTNRKQKEIIPESRMPSTGDTATFPQLFIWTTSNWNVISRWYWGLVSGQTKPDAELEAFTRKLIADKKTDEEKINEVFTFVSQKIRYVAVLLGPHTHQPHAAAEIFQKRYGDCKDKTVLLLTMLKIAGIKALPVLVPSDDENFDETVPALEVFNHVIAAIPTRDNKYIWLDATNEAAAFNSTPFMRPTTVFVINTDGSYSFVKTPALDDKKDFYYSDMKYVIDAEGHAYTDSKSIYSGKAAESIRYTLKYSSPEQRRKYFEEKGFEVKELNFGSFTNTQEPFVINVKGTIKNLAQWLDEDTMVLSGVIGLDSFRDITAAKKRTYPITFYDTFYSQKNYSFVFPRGFKIKKLPRVFTVNEPFQYRNEEYNFNGYTFDVSIEAKGMEHRIKLDNLDYFKKYAATLQEHESALKNIIFQKN